MQRQTTFALFVFLALGLAACAGPATRVAGTSAQATQAPDAYDFAATAPMAFGGLTVTAPPGTQPPLFQAELATAAPVDESAPGSTSQLAFAPSGSRMVIKDATLDLLVG